MKKFILTRKGKGKSFKYTVTDEHGNVVSTRLSTHGEFVACTANGEFYFRNLDLIFKGSHGAKLKEAIDLLNDTWGEYKNIIKLISKDKQDKWVNENPFYGWAETAIEKALRTKSRLTEIAYLEE